MKTKWISIILALLFVPSFVAAQGTAINMCEKTGGGFKATACDTDGQLQVDVLDITPGTGSTDLGKAEDAAHTSGDTGIQILVRRSENANAPAVSCDTNGDYCALNGDASGFLWVRERSSAAEDVGFSSGDRVLPIAMVRSDTIGAATRIAGTDGDVAPPLLDALGALWTDPVASTTTVCVAITPDNDAAYTANDVVATEDATDPLSFASVFRTNVNSGILNSIQITNTEPDAVGWRVVLFDADPSTSTTTDGSALTVADADLTKIVGQVSVSDCTSYADNELCQATGVNLAIDGAATGIYAALITPGTPQWAASQTVNVCLTFSQD